MTAKRRRKKLQRKQRVTAQRLAEADPSALDRIDDRYFKCESADEVQLMFHEPTSGLTVTYSRDGITAKVPARFKNDPLLHALLAEGYCRWIRESPLWDEMVREHGVEGAERIVGETELDLQVASELEQD